MAKARLLWPSNALDVLAKTVVPVARTTLHGEVRHALDRPPFHGMYVIPGTSRTFEADALTCLFGTPATVIVGRPFAPATMSPIVWMKERSDQYVQGDARERFRVIRNALLRQRFCRQWNVRILRLESIVQHVFSNFSSSFATPEERIRVLPKLLYEAQRGGIKVCYVADSSPLDDLRRYTFAEDWCIELQYLPGSTKAPRDVFYLSALRESLNEHLRGSIAALDFKSSHLTPSVLDAAADEGNVNRRNREVIGELLDRLRTYWSCKVHPQKSTMQLLDAVIKAVRNGDEYADKPFSIPGDFELQEQDAEILCDQLQHTWVQIGMTVQFRKPEVIFRKIATAKTAATAPEDADEMHLDEGCCSVTWQGRPVGVRQTTEFQVFHSLWQQKPKMVTYSRLLSMIWPDRADRHPTEAPQELKDIRAKINRALKEAGCPFRIVAYRARGYAIVRSGDQSSNDPRGRLRQR